MSGEPVYEAGDDSYVLLDVLQKELASRDDVDTLTFLDMGAGSGVIGFEVAKLGVKQITFVDHNLNAVTEIQKIIDAEDLPFAAIYSDLFAQVKGEYDIIAFNTPYLPNELGEEVHDSALHGGPSGIEVAVRFLKQVKDHLKPQGKIFLLTSSLADYETLLLSARSLGLQSKLVEKLPLFFEQLHVYELQRNEKAFSTSDEVVIASLKDVLPDEFHEPALLAAGKRGVIFAGTYHQKPVVAKVLRPGVDARNTIHLEATYLKKANAHGIGPQLYVATPEYVIMEHVQGMLIREFLEQQEDEHVIREVLTEIFSQLRSLDQLGLNKFELTNPYKHIIVTEDNHPVLLDFERMRHSARPKNVTQFAQYVTSKAVLPLLQTKGLLVHVDEFSAAITAYSQGGEAVFEQYL